MDNFESRINQLNELIGRSNSIVFFGGAGVSTESGVPDFRSKDGLYNQHNVLFDKYQPEYLLSRDCLIDHPEIFFEFYRQKFDCRNIQPNITHKVLTELEKSGKLECIVTQNVDGLHQKAGSSKIAEIHGTTFENCCDECGQIYNGNYIFESKETIPHCECGGVIRPSVTLYQENLPVDAWQMAAHAIKNADLLIIGGTSLNVYPAADLISEYRHHDIVMINRDSTQKDDRATLIFRENLGDVFSKVKF